MTSPIRQAQIQDFEPVMVPCPACRGWTEPFGEPCGTCQDEGQITALDAEWIATEKDRRAAETCGRNLEAARRALLHVGIDPDGDEAQGRKS